MDENKKVWKPGDIIELTDYEKQLLRDSQSQGVVGARLLQTALEVQADSAGKADAFWRSVFVRLDFPEGLKLQYNAHKESVIVLEQADKPFLQKQLEEKSLKLQIMRLEQRIAAAKDKKKK